MANNCLVTKLKSVVSNSELPTLNAFTLKVNYVENPDVSANVIVLNSIGDFTVKTSDGGSHLGTSAGVYGQSSISNTSEIYFENSNYSLIVTGKYEVYYMYLGQNLYFNVDELEYNTSDFSTLIALGGDKVTGNIKNIPNTVSNVILNNTNITGDIEVIANWSNYDPTILNLYDNLLYGDICNAVAAKTCTQIFANNVNIVDTTTGWVGNLVNMPSTLKAVSTYMRTANFTWIGTRASSSPAISIYGNPNLGEYVDAMLINQAQCDLSNPIDEYNKKIEVFGSHDPNNAEANAAIATIKAAGWTVTINTQPM